MEPERAHKWNSKISVESKKSNRSSCRSLDRGSWEQRDYPLNKQHSMVEYPFLHSESWALRALANPTFTKKCWLKNQVTHTKMLTLRSTKTFKQRKKVVASIHSKLLSNSGISRPIIVFPMTKNRISTTPAPAIYLVTRKIVPVLEPKMNHARKGYVVLCVLQQRQREQWDQE